MNWEDAVELAKITKRKTYISETLVRQYSPQSIITYEPILNGETYEIKFDSIQEFFRKNNVKMVFIDKKINQRNLPITIFDQSTVIIQCIIIRN